MYIHSPIDLFDRLSDELTVFHNQVLTVETSILQILEETETAINGSTLEHLQNVDLLAQSALSLKMFLENLKAEKWPETTFNLNNHVRNLPLHDMKTRLLNGVENGDAENSEILF